jgi:hypothetical protein
MLPDEEIALIAQFVCLRDFAFLLASCKRIHMVLNKESVYKSIAEIYYPPHLLDVSNYDGSWKDLVQNDNARNMVYVRVLNEETDIILDTEEFFACGKALAMVRDRGDDTVGYFCKKLHFQIKSGNPRPVVLSETGNRILLDFLSAKFHHQPYGTEFSLLYYREVEDYAQWSMSLPRHEYCFCNTPYDLFDRKSKMVLMASRELAGENLEYD